MEDELGRRKREYQLNMEEEQEGFVERLKSLRSVRGHALTSFTSPQSKAWSHAHTPPFSASL